MSARKRSSSDRSVTTWSMAGIPARWAARQTWLRAYSTSWLPPVRRPPMSAMKSSAPKYAPLTPRASRIRASATPSAVSSPATSSPSSRECSAITCRTWSSWCWLSSFGTTSPAAAQSAAIATSSANHGVPTGFTRISTMAAPSGSSAPTPAAAMSLAASLASAGTASSRSTTATSGARRGIFAIMPARLAGMNSMLRTRVSSAITCPGLAGPGLAGTASSRPGRPGRPFHRAG